MFIRVHLICLLSLGILCCGDNPGYRKYPSDVATAQESSPTDAKPSDPAEYTRMAMADFAEKYRVGRENDSNRLDDILLFEQLNLRHAGIEDLSPVSEMTNLRKLIVDGNRITDLTPLAELRRLEHLRVENNRIVDISPIKGCLELEYLLLEYNDIVDISALSSLKNLWHLSARNNKISDISVLSHLKKLQRIDLRENQIAILPEFGKLPELRELYLGGNLITDPSPLRGFAGPNSSFLPRRLDLSGNPLEEIVSLQGMGSLDELDLSNCGLRDVTPLGSLRDLNYLDLSNNEIADISFLENMAELGYLDLRNNDIEDIQPLVNMLKKRKHSMFHLDIRDNPITDAKGIKSIRKKAQEFKMGATLKKESEPVAAAVKIKHALIGKWKTDKLDSEWGEYYAVMEFFKTGSYEMSVVFVDSQGHATTEDEDERPGAKGPFRIIEDIVDFNPDGEFSDRRRFHIEKDLLTLEPIEDSDDEAEPSTGLGDDRMTLRRVRPFLSGILPIK